MRPHLRQKEKQLKRKSSNFQLTPEQSSSQEQPQSSSQEQPGRTPGQGCGADMGSTGPTEATEPSETDGPDCMRSERSPEEAELATAMALCASTAYGEQCWFRIRFNGSLRRSHTNHTRLEFTK